MLGYLLSQRHLELYQINFVDDRFDFTVSEAYYFFLLEKIKQEEWKKALHALPKKQSNGLVVFSIYLPFITFPNYQDKRIHWDVIKECAKQISLILRTCNLNFKDVDYTPYALNANKQLMAIETGFSNNGDYVVSPISIGFSKHAVQLLADTYKNGAIFGDHAKAVLRVHSRLSETSQSGLEERSATLKKYGADFMGMTVGIRPGGTPHFIVPGNCACLGANPSEFMEDCEMYSHSLDNPLQQMTMLVAVVIFWNEVLKPLDKAAHHP